MNDFIDVKLAFSNYIHNIADVVYRYVNNGGLKKVLIFPLFLIILLLEISLFPIALIGAIAKWIIYLLVSLTEDRSSMLYVFVIMFVEFFLLYYVMFVILILFYKLFDLMSNGLGRANYEYDADEFVSQHELKRDLENNRDVEEKKEEIYVINDEDYK
ncbi:MAG: hypothetical protein K6E24_05325 [bacterium]|nr:hypothetical protein [bacterium]